MSRSIPSTKCGRTGENLGRGRGNNARWVSKVLRSIGRRARGCTLSACRLSKRLDSFERFLPSPPFPKHLSSALSISGLKLYPLVPKLHLGTHSFAQLRCSVKEEYFARRRGGLPIRSVCLRVFRASVRNDSVLTILRRNSFLGMVRGLEKSGSGRSPTLRKEFSLAALDCIWERTCPRNSVARPRGTFHTEARRHGALSIGVTLVVSVPPCETVWAFPSLTAASIVSRMLKEWNLEHPLEDLVHHHLDRHRGARRRGL